jgi:ABC-type multidrug transport system ATPase subunit
LFHELTIPISGLDSPTAYAITTLLKQISQAGHLIVATVHQPSSAIFFSFDTLCLLAQGRYVAIVRVEIFQTKVPAQAETRLAVPVSVTCLQQASLPWINQ